MVIRHCFIAMLYITVSGCDPDASLDSGVSFTHESDAGNQPACTAASGLTDAGVTDAALRQVRVRDQWHAYFVRDDRRAGWISSTEQWG